MSAPVTLQQLTDQLDALEQQASVEIAEAVDAAALEQLRVGLLGKKGRISGVLVKRVLRFLNDMATKDAEGYKKFTCARILIV